MALQSTAAVAVNDFAAAARAGLTKVPQKELPSKYLYDSLGSKLFEAICELPEYGLTRADERLLRRYAKEIASHVPGRLLVCELGSGSGRKTRRILEALTYSRNIHYFPVEISATALALCRQELNGIPSLAIVGLEQDYLSGLRQVASRREPNQKILTLFLGSTIGNFSPPADVDFLREVRRCLRPGDFLLLGTDLIKTVSRLITAYDDPLGVTAAFNLNILARINRELDADFDLSRFRHEAIFNEKTGSIEMHLRSLEHQFVHVAAAGLRVEFREGETIWTENSHKFTLPEVCNMAATAGFKVCAQWVDEEWPFAESLLCAGGTETR